MKPSPRIRQQGFLLITVLVVLGVLAAMAIMLSSSTSLDNALVANLSEAATLDYAAESGLQHATWLLYKNDTCTGYANIAATPFADAQYSATVTPTSGSPVVVEAIGTLADGTQRTIIRTGVKAYSTAAIQTVTLQPGEDDGVDTYIWDGLHKDTNFGATSEMELNNASAERVMLLRFDLTSLPHGSVVTNAKLKLYLKSGVAISNGVVDAHRVTQFWYEGVDDDTLPTAPGATYMDYDGTNAWASSGGDYDPTPVSSTVIPSLTQDWYQWDVTALTQGGSQAEITQNGVLLRASGGLVEKVQFISSDGGANVRPKLVVSYSCECGVPCAAADGSDDRLILATETDATLGGLNYLMTDIVDYAASSDSATLFLDSVAIGLIDQIDAIHVLENEHIVFSATANMTFAGLSFNKEDLIEYDPVADMAMMYLEALVHFSSAKNITSVHVLSDGNVVFGADGNGSIGGIDFDDKDLVEYDRNSGTASIFFDGGAAGLSRKITAAHILPSGNIILAADRDVTLGGVSFGKGQLVEYDPLADTATLYFDGDILFAAPEKIVAVHVGPGSGQSEMQPVAHWKLDETGGVTALDSAGGNDGTLINGPSWTPGKFDGGLSFDGNDDYIIAASLNPMSYDDFTVSAWYKSATFSVNDDQTIFEHNDNFAYEVAFGPTDDGTGDQLRFGFANGGSGTWDPHYGTSDIVDQDWHHVVGVRSGGRIKLYVDGAQESDGPDAHAGVTVTIDGDGPFIGDLPGATEQVHGILDDVRLYDRALTSTEIISLFAATGGSGGGGGTGGAYRDEFNNQNSYAGSDGSLTWSTDWLEINESDGAEAGDEMLIEDAGKFQLRVTNSDGGGEGVEREADLSVCSSASLNFDFRRKSFDDSDDYVTVDVSANGGSSWIELDRLAGPADESTYQAASYDISAYMAVDSRIRFLSSSSLKRVDELFVDNVHVVCQ